MKTLREQMLECRASGNLIEVDVSKHNYILEYYHPGKKPQQFKIGSIDVCLKYKKACDGSVCRKDRGIE